MFEDDCHNPYFNRWFSAIMGTLGVFNDIEIRHNPYFNRWFSAILSTLRTLKLKEMSQSLF